MNNNQTYSQQYCYLICLQNQVIKRCNCSIIWLPNYKNYTVCNYDQKDCSTSSVTEILEGKQNLNCTSSCPTECEFIEYKVSTSRATYPTEYYRDLLSTHSIINSSGINIQDIDKAVLRVNVFYETMSYTTITETLSITPETFFSNIGGTLGLCLGVSILSIVEILELIINFYDVFKEYKTKTKKIKITNDIKS